MIPGVCQRKGLTYRRFRVKLADGRWGDHYIRLPDPTDPAFAEELARVNKEPAARSAPARESIGALVIEYRTALARRDDITPVTRANYQRYLELISNEHGHRLVKDLRPAQVFRLRDKMADLPGKANNYLSILRTLLSFACERDWIASNPAAKVPPLELGEHDPWPAEAIRDALEKASPMLALAIITGLCSGQRIGDVIRMQHGWHDGSIMELTQSKTGKDVAVPMHPLWLDEIAAIPRRAVTILYDRQGKPFGTTEAVQARIRRLMKEIGHEGLSFHGLRKNACCYLLELGLSDTEVGSNLGMTSEMVQHYGKRARALMIARGTHDRVTRGNLLPFRGNSLRNGGEK